MGIVLGVKGGDTGDLSSEPDPNSSGASTAGAGVGFGATLTSLTTFGLPLLMTLFPFQREGMSLGLSADMHHR